MGRPGPAAPERANEEGLRRAVRRKVNPSSSQERTCISSPSDNPAPGAAQGLSSFGQCRIPSTNGPGWHADRWISIARGALSLPSLGDSYTASTHYPSAVKYIVFRSRLLPLRQWLRPLTPGCDHRYPAPGVLGCCTHVASGTRIWLPRRFRLQQREPAIETSVVLGFSPSTVRAWRAFERRVAITDAARQMSGTLSPR